VYIDSEINSIGNGQVSRIQFPSTAFSIRPGQMMKMVLTSFEMRRNWYSINATNNKFYFYDPAAAVGSQYTEVAIVPGSYRSFGTASPSPAGSLALAIETAIVAAGLGAATVGWDEVSRKFQIVMVAATPATGYFVCFQVKQSPDNPDPANISESGYFNDSAEILGGRPTRDNWTVPINAMAGVGPGNHTSPYVGALNTIETIFLRSSLQTNNYQSYGFERNLPNQSGLTPTTIFARIPLSRAYYNDEFEIIQFEDTNDLFSILLQQTQLSDMLFEITDHAGRRLQEVSVGQANDGNLAFKLSFRWEVVEQETPQGEYQIRPPPLQNQRIPNSLGGV
tara:strand:- start:634 stop:1644 length:1011 start_codon:yes stop_codon:yes gene_type:complete